MPTVKLAQNKYNTIIIIIIIIIIIQRVVT